MKKYWGLIVLIGMFLLAACGQAETVALDEEEVKEEVNEESEDTGETANESEPEEEDDEPSTTVEADVEEMTAAEEEPVFDEMSTEEVKDIMLDNFEELDQVMKDLHNDYYNEWFGAEWAENPDNDPEGYEKAYGIVSERFSDLVTEEEMEDMVFRYIYAYFYDTHLSGKLDENQVNIRFEVLEQTEDSFTVSYITLGNGYPMFPGTSELQYEKVDGNWKFNGEEYTSPDEEPLNLTSDDFNDYKNGESVTAEFVEEVEVDGETFIILKFGEVYEARNVATSELNYELGKSYGNQPENEEGKSEEAVSEVTTDENEQDSSASGTIKLQEKPIEYETVSEQDTGDLHNIKVSYPVFSHKSLDALIGDLIMEEYNEKIEKNSRWSDIESQYVFNIDFEEPFATDRFVSIVFSEFTFEGGVHGNPFTRPLNYDLQNNRIIELEDILDEDLKKLDALSEITYDKLVADGVVDPNDSYAENAKRATEPKAENFSDFELTKDKVIFHFQPYAVAPFSAGIVEVEFTYDEIADL
ncbi:DUF3298 and DUF4163 domain-containing protein [Virgibacillus ainsalahensis]